MVADYKPTHDPNLDTFKVQYLIGGSAILALLFPMEYRISEVRASLFSESLLYTVQIRCCRLSLRLCAGKVSVGADEYRCRQTLIASYAGVVVY